jgi:hypothetical protein
MQNKRQKLYFKLITKSGNNIHWSGGLKVVVAYIPHETTRQIAAVKNVSACLVTEYLGKPDTTILTGPFHHCHSTKHLT